MSTFADLERRSSQWDDDLIQLIHEIDGVFLYEVLATASQYRDPSNKSDRYAIAWFRDGEWIAYDATCASDVLINAGIPEDTATFIDNLMSLLP